MDKQMELAILIITIVAGFIVALLGGITAPDNRLGWFMLIAGVCRCMVG